MVHQKYFQEGSQIILPEITGRHSIRDPRFAVIKILAGGMGECVQLKHEVSGINYALKCIKPDLVGDRAAVDRFYDELQVWLSASMCSLVTEAIEIVRINEFPCILAEWAGRGDLSSWLPKMSPKEKFETALRTVKGLAWVRNNLSVIHRDIKPANILIDDDGLSYITDWGLARPVVSEMSRINEGLSNNAISRPDRTQAGSFVGTIYYAAPEQIKGDVAIDHRADIYSLGCMMFEFETGRPPFLGSTALEIAYKQMHENPPSIGGLLGRSKLGLDHIISRCLEKDPSNRYNDYKELVDDLLVVAQKRKFNLSRCEVAQRYDRNQIGKGYKELKLQLTQAIKSKKGDYLSTLLEDSSRFFEEADNLISLKRYRDAEQILWHFYIPESISEPSDFHIGHSIASNYAYCCTYIDGRLNEALSIYDTLFSAGGKPVELYINYALALIKNGEYAKAKKICQEGLVLYPDDIDLLGNQTISLLFMGDVENALDSAFKRIEIRRDIHSIEELVSVLANYRTNRRNSDLPHAIEIAKNEGELIKEGLTLNPRFLSLLLKQIQLYRFAHDGESATKLCEKLIAADGSHYPYKELALLETLMVLKQQKQLEEILSTILEFENQIRVPRIKSDLVELKMSLYADNYMIGKDGPDGKRIVIPEVVDYYLASDPNIKRDQVMKAKVLEWLGRDREAVELLKQHLAENLTDWDAIKTMALFLERANQRDDAIQFANILIEKAPWKAESYDLAKYIYKKFGDTEKAKKMQQKGDEIFSQEMELFRDLKASLGKPKL